MIDSSKIDLFEKYLSATDYAFGSDNKPAQVSDADKLIYQEVYGPLENLSQTQWSQIESGVKALMKEHGPDIPLESLKAMKHNYDNYHTEKEVALDFMGNQQ